MTKYPLFWCLKELMLVVEHSLKFLDTLSFRRKNKFMLSLRQGFKITRSVIILNPIKMVNNPAFRQWLIVSLFPNKKMFTDIAIAVCIAMARLVYKYIPIRDTALSLSFNKWVSLPPLLSSATFTTFPQSTNEPTTIQTRMPTFLVKFLHIIGMLFTPLSRINNKFCTVVIMPLLAVFFFITHINIIALFWCFINDR